MIHRHAIPGPFARLAIGVLVVLMFPKSALAHAELVTSTPATGATVASPFEGPIVMTFSEALADGSKADLHGPDGTTIAAATVDGPGATMTVTLDASLAPGDYEVRWVSVADDADLERGTISFTVAPASPTSAPTPSPTPSPSPTGATADVVLPIIVALLVVVAGAVFLLTRRARPTSAR